MTKRAEKSIRDRRAAARLFDKVVGTRVCSRREKARMEAGDAAPKLGLSTTQLYRCESGATSIKPYLLDQMARLYGAKVADFVDGINVEALLK